jgi:phosphonoacetaldehyde hydrolase
MKIQAVVFDWAGTVVDYGCHAPVAVLNRIFGARGVPLEPVESRHAMGLLKIDQIREIIRLPRVSAAWEAEHGKAPEESDVRQLFEAFAPIQMDCIEEYSDVIDGVPELVEKLRSKGIKIGSTTGYTRPMLDRLLPKAARQGYAPDCILTPDEIGQGRPYPWMIFENMKRLGVYPPAHCVKVGDTASDMQEGRNAGLICVGVCDSSSDAVIGGPENARRVLEESGAHRTIGTSPELWNILEEL